MVPFRVLSRTNLAGCPPSISCTSSISFASFRLRTLDFSLRSFSHLDPLFSITSALFSQNTGGCGYQHFRVTLCLRRRMRHVALVSPVPSLDCVYFPSPRGCTTNLRFSLLGVSVPLWQPILFALCFHTLTNCFSRNPFPFTSIQIPRGCAPQLRDFRSPLPGLSIFRHSHGQTFRLLVQCWQFPGGPGALANRGVWREC